MYNKRSLFFSFFFFQAEDGIRDVAVTGVQTCALPISEPPTNTPCASPREAQSSGAQCEGGWADARGFTIAFDIVRLLQGPRLARESAERACPSSSFRLPC